MSWSWSQCSTYTHHHHHIADPPRESIVDESLSWWQCHRHKELDHQNKGSQHDSLAKKNISGPAKDKIKQNNKNNNNLKLVLALQPGQWK